MTIYAHSVYFSKTYWDMLEVTPKLATENLFYDVVELMQLDQLGELKRNRGLTANINHQFGPDKITFLHMAYKLNKSECVALLKKMGANETLCDAKGHVPKDAQLSDYCDDKFNRLVNMVHSSSLDAFKASPDLKDVTDINCRFGPQMTTLLHAAYKFNRPDFVKFFKDAGALETIPDALGFLPMDDAADAYEDDLPERVINDVAMRYLQQVANKPDPHTLFDFLLTFLRDRNWTYLDRSARDKKNSFRVGSNLSTLGDANLLYRINCSDLSCLFKKSAKKVGIAAEVIWYKGNRTTIARSEKEKAGVIGELRMLNSALPVEDESELQFRSHSVALCAGWYFDLLFQCKYQNKLALLKPKVAKNDAPDRIQPQEPAATSNMTQADLKPAVSAVTMPLVLPPAAIQEVAPPPAIIVVENKGLAISGIASQFFG